MFDKADCFIKHLSKLINFHSLLQVFEFWLDHVLVHVLIFQLGAMFLWFWQVIDTWLDLKSSHKGTFKTFRFNFCLFECFSSLVLQKERPTTSKQLLQLSFFKLNYRKKLLTMVQCPLNVRSKWLFPQRLDPHCFRALALGKWLLLMDFFWQ